MKAIFVILVLSSIFCSEPVFATKSGKGFVLTQTIEGKNKTRLNKLDRKKRRHGKWEFYWDDENTKVVSKGKFRHGNQIRKWSYYSQDGTLERTERETFLGKRLKTKLYHPNGKVWKKGSAKVVIEDEYVNYYWYGKWKCFTSKGKFEKYEVYEKGELVGAADTLMLNTK